MATYLDNQRAAADAAGFKAPLAEYVEISETGFASFCYPMFTGHLKYVATAAHEQLQAAARLRGKDQVAAFKKVAEFVASEHALIEQVSDAWSAHIEARRLAFAARAA